MAGSSDYSTEEKGRTKWDGMTPTYTTSQKSLADAVDFLYKVKEAMG